MKSVLVIGMGRFGRHLAKKMQELGNDVMVIDKNSSLIDEVSSEFSDAQIGDCTNENVLKALGVNNFDLCFVTIGENFQSSLVITLRLKKLGARYVVAKASQDIQAELLKTIGADEVVYPEREISEKLAVRYNAKNIFDFVQLTSEYSIYEIPILPEWVGGTIGKIDVRKKHKINIIAVKNGDKVEPMPGVDYVFRPEDHIMVIGRSSDVFRLTSKT